MMRLLPTGLLLLAVLCPLAFPATQASAGPLIARGDRAFAPYEFIDAGGRPTGFNIELLEAIADRLEMDVDVGLEEGDAVMDAFSRGSVDIVTGMVRSAERERQFDFSITHTGIF
ncbi:MAG: transporter substrate-binding domain-containing protein, partial [Desulfosarcina sp.]